MTKHKNKILVLGCLGVLIAIFGAWHTAEAADVSIYVEPTQANKEVGDSFVIAVKVDPNGQKVCVAEGKLNLSKLSCQKITMESGISPQLYPSCDDLGFMLGIQGCTTSEKILFTVTVKAENTGTGTANFTEVDIIGEGVPLSFVSSNGTYQITAIPTATTPSCECGNWGYWQSSTCGKGTCPSTQRFQSQTRTCTPSACDIEIKSRCIDDSSCVATLESEEKKEVAGVETATGELLEVEKETTSTKENAEDTLSKEVLGDILLADISNSWWGKITESTSSTIVVILGFIVLIVIGVMTWWTRRKKIGK